MCIRDRQNPASEGFSCEQSAQIKVMEWISTGLETSKAGVSYIQLKFSRVFPQNVFDRNASCSVETLTRNVERVMNQSEECVKS